MFRILLVFFIIYLIVKLIQSYTRDYTSQRSNNYSDDSSRKEGEISVENLQSQKDKKVSSDEGEYVNYEEL